MSLPVLIEFRRYKKMIEATHGQVSDEALNTIPFPDRSVCHVSYHAGQIVLLGRMYAGERWKWLSIPKGKSEEYNANPYWEKPS